MVRHLKLFDVEERDLTVIVCPQGEGSAFRYQDLHMESNTVRGYLQQPGKRNLIVDMQNMEYCGSEFIGALVSMLRETRNRGGKAVFCAAQPQMQQVLQNMSLFKLWPHFDTREAALASIAAANSDTPN
jgi:anti-sigma B factor antagonist